CFARVRWILGRVRLLETFIADKAAFTGFALPKPASKKHSVNAGLICFWPGCRFRRDAFDDKIS
ncbi:MAG TPA: hypothetical protein VFN66_00580, partial [Burkholderiales bacterium]|nr:hypothetical protein [Burkholderiales bacterium]